MPFSVYVFEELRFPIELLTATLLFMLPFAEKKSSFYLRAILGLLFTCAISMLYFAIFGLDKPNPRFPFGTVFWYLLITLFSTVYARLCFIVSRTDAAFFGGLSFALQNIVYSFYHIFMAKQASNWLRMHLLIYILGAAFVTTIIYYFVYRLYSPKLKAAEGAIFVDNPKNLARYTIINILIYVFLIFYQTIQKQGYSEFDQMSWLSGMLTSVLILLVQYNALTALTYSSKTKLMEQMLTNSEHYYELSKEHIAIINRKCHDLKHQLKILRTVSEDEREEYINEAEKSIIFYQDLIYTQNEALNTILAEKGLFCRENDIEFHCSVDGADLSFIRVSDLYALIGNAIDNAIEYAKKQTDETLRSISLRIDKKMNFIGIQISNPLANSDSEAYTNIDPENLKSTKSDKENHGYGLKSIRYLTEKYNGSLEISTKGDVFTMQIVIPV